jgi:hypothetical protein
LWPSPVPIPSTSPMLFYWKLAFLNSRKIESTKNCNTPTPFSVAVETCYPGLTTPLTFYNCLYSLTCSRPEYSWNTAHWTLNSYERSGPKRPTLIENYTGSLTCMECGIFHTLWSTIRLSYYDPITPQQEGFPYPPPVQSYMDLHILVS